MAVGAVPVAIVSYADRMQVTLDGMPVALVNGFPNRCK
jgi:hypothetical protein